MCKVANTANNQGKTTIKENYIPEFTNAAIKRIFERAGAKAAKLRISEESKTQLRDTLNQLGDEIAHYAIKLTHQTGKKTLTAETVRMATKWILEGGREPNEALEEREE